MGRIPGIVLLDGEREPEAIAADIVTRGRVASDTIV